MRRVEPQAVPERLVGDGRITAWRVNASTGNKLVLRGVHRAVNCAAATFGHNGCRLNDRARFALHDEIGNAAGFATAETAEAIADVVDQAGGLGLAVKRAEDEVTSSGMAPGQAVAFQYKLEGGALLQRSEVDPVVNSWRGSAQGGAWRGCALRTDGIGL